MRCITSAARRGVGKGEGTPPTGFFLFRLDLWQQGWDIWRGHSTALDGFLLVVGLG